MPFALLRQQSPKDFKKYDAYSQTAHYYLNKNQYFTLDGTNYLP